MTAKWIRGPSNAVPCPHCKEANDCQELVDLGLLSPKESPTLECDHCHQHFEVVRVQPMVIVYVRPVE